MKNFKLTLFGLATGAMLLTAVTSQNAQATSSIDFSSIIGADIVFNGTGGFYFKNATSGAGAGNSFQVINASADLPGDSVGDYGNMTGTYTIGTITSKNGGETASVTGSGILTISDGSFSLTGTLVWDDITTVGTGSTLNINGMLNVTGVTYAGSQVDLQTLAASGGLSDTVDFTFNPAKPLTTLADTSLKTTFSGSIATVPDGAVTVELLGGALLAIGAVRRKFSV